MTDIIRESELSIEDRLTLIESRIGIVGPLALVPPITIGSLTNVPVPGSQIAAQWAQDVSGMVVHRFATKAALAAWAAAVGAFAVQTDTGVLWRRVAGGWAQQTPWTGHTLGSDWSFADAAPRKVASFNIPADPGPRRATLFVTQRVDLVPGNTTTVDLAVDGVTQTSVFVDARSDASPPGVPWHVHNAAPSAGNVSIPTGRAVEVAIWVTPSAAFTAQVYASHSRLDALVAPQGLLMATDPPITIGPFANVPAPGSGVKSDWAQQITNYVLRTAWVTVPVLSSGWVIFDANHPVQYRKVGDDVQIRGLVKSGSTGLLFTLPAGFRPAQGDETFPVVANDAFGQVSVLSNGNVTVTGSAVFTYLSGIRYSTVA